MSKKCGENCGCHKNKDATQVDIVCEAFDSVLDSIEELFKKTDHLLDNSPPSSNKIY